MSEQTGDTRGRSWRARATLVGLVALTLSTCRGRVVAPAPPPGEETASGESAPAPGEPAPAPGEPAPASEPAPADPGPSRGTGADAPALQVTELTPVRVGVELRVEARLRWVTTRCTASVPPSCAGEWRLLDARGAKSQVVRLEERGVALPIVCVKPSGALTAASPCPSGAALEDARYLFTGALREGPEGLVFVLSAARRLD